MVIDEEVRKVFYNIFNVNISKLLWNELTLLMNCRISEHSTFVIVIESCRRVHPSAYLTGIVDGEELRADLMKGPNITRHDRQCDESNDRDALQP